MAHRDPKYYAVNDRPLVLAQMPDGSEAVLVFDFATGNLIADPSYYKFLTPGSGKDVDSLTEQEFEQQIARSRVELLRMWCERMCSLPTGATPELEALVGIGTPGSLDQVALGGERIEIDGDAHAITLHLPRGVMTRALLEKRFGTGTDVPRAEGASPNRFAYRVDVARADHRCSLTATAHSPELGSDIAALTFRMERNHGVVLAKKVRGWAERLCSVRSMSKQDLAAALGGAAESRPEGVTQIELDDREVGLGGVNVRFAPGLVRRANILASFGAGAPLAQLSPNHPIRIMHEVQPPGAPHTCSVFVEYSLDALDDVVRGVKLRVDPVRTPTTN